MTQKSSIDDSRNELLRNNTMKCRKIYVRQNLHKQPFLLNYPRIISDMTIDRREMKTFLKHPL